MFRNDFRHALFAGECLHFYEYARSQIVKMNIGSVNFEGDFFEKLKQFSGRGSKMDCLLKKGVVVKNSLSPPAESYIMKNHC